MSREVTDLRRAGRLEEAYELAIRERKEEPGAWSDTALFWVLYDMAKLNLQRNSPQAKLNAKECMDRMQELSTTIIDDSDTAKNCLSWLRKQLIDHYDTLKAISEQSKSNPIAAYDKAVLLCGSKGESIDSQLHEDFGWIIYRYMRVRLEELTSLEVRGLLRDYMSLKNPRPSMLHSTILGFAAKFARTHHDFIFPNFLKLWGVDNFTREDKYNGLKDGTEIPSLLERVCGTLTLYSERMVCELSNATKKSEQTIADFQSKAIFWRLHGLRENNDYKVFWDIARDYMSDYMAFPGTHWHTEILSLITRSVNDNTRDAFLTIADIIAPYTIKGEDFAPQKGADGNEYPAPIIQLVRKCYELAKKDKSLRSRTSLLSFLNESYRIIENCCEDDQYRREHAKVLVWSGKGDAALPIYLELLKLHGDKYYIWEETGECIEDAQLQVGFFLRALELEKAEDIIGPLRIKTARGLAGIGLVPPALILLDSYALNRSRQGKAKPDEWHKANEFVRSATPTTSPIDPQSLVIKAMDVAYSDYDPKEYVLTDRFKAGERTMISFADGEDSFVVNPKRFPNIAKLEVGSIVIVRGYKRKEFIQNKSFPFQVSESSTTVPLMIKTTNSPKWSILQEDVGYISYVNPAKQMCTVITSNSSETFFHDEKNVFKKGDFIRFRRYIRQREDKKIITVATPQLCTQEEALPKFRHRVVAVDGVNPDKSLFHIVLGKNLVSDIVHYNETPLRPNIGDLLNLTYCIRKDKQGKKRIIILSISKAESSITSPLLHVEEGDLRTSINAKGRIFGFVGDTYISTELIESTGINDGDSVKVHSVMTPEGKWKAFCINLTKTRDDY